MTRGTRWLLAVLVGGTLLVAATIGVSVAAVFSGGTIAVSVDDRDHDRVSVAVPAGLAQIAIGLTPSSVMREAVEDVDPRWLTAARAGVERLERMDDFVLAEVTSPDEQVLIAKRGKRIVVRVDGDDGAFEVAIPLRTVRSALRKASRASGV